VDGNGEESGTFLLQGQFTQSANVVPSITGHPTNRTVLPNTSVTFTVSAQPASLSYQWYFNGIALAGETGSSLTIPNVQPANVGHYAVQITNQLGGQSVLSRMATLEIGSQPGVQSFDKLEDLLQASGNGLAGFLQPARIQKQGPVTSIGFLSVSAGLPVSQLLNNAADSSTQTRDPLPCGIIGSASRWLGLEAAGDGFIRLDSRGSSNAVSLAVYRLAPGYETSINTLVRCDSSGASGPDFITVQFQTTNGALYLVEVDSAESEKGFIQLNCRLGLPPWKYGDPPDWASVPTNLIYSYGDDKTLVAPDEINNIDPSSYQWFRDGYALGSNRELSLIGLQPTDAGLYSVLVSNYFGSLTYQVALLRVNVPLQFLGIGVEPPDAFDLDVAGNFGQGFIVEAATDITDFAPGNVIDLETNRLSKNVQTVTVTNTVPADRLFYRLRSE